MTDTAPAEGTPIPHELELTAESQVPGRTWSRLLRVHDGEGLSSVFGVGEDGSLSRFSQFDSASMRFAEGSFGGMNSAASGTMRSDTGEAALDFESPHAVDHFMLGPRIGQGGMAVVHEALLPGEPERYAVKLCRPEGSSTIDQSFAIEVAVMGALRHDHIVPLVAHGETAAGLRWLAMPMVPGQSLRRLLDRSEGVQGSDRESLLRSVLLPAFLQLCDAVDHAHGMGVLHCDLKPANVIVDPRGHAWLLDWGMTKTFAKGGEAPGPRDLRSPAVTPVGGTPGYMSPEQIRGRADRLGPWSDVWSLGAILYELISGQRAYQRGEADTLRFFRKMLKNPPTRADLRVLLPANVAMIAPLCARALSRIPSRRPKSAGDLADVLRGVLTQVGWV